MTLIIYIKCADATILVLDRKESNTSDVGQITKKYYLPTNLEFVLALAGESIRIDTIVSDLHIDQNVTAENIREKLYDIIEKSPKFVNIESMASGLLLIRDGNIFKFNNVWFTNSQKSIVEENQNFKCYGEGSSLADYLLRKFNFSNFAWNEACQHLIAIFQDVSKRVDSVGSIENYGIDILVFTNDGELKQATIHDSNNIDGITCAFKIHDDFEISFSTSSLSTEEPLSTKLKRLTLEGIKLIHANDKKYSINYQIHGGEITSIQPMEDTFSLLISLQTISDGELTITLPRNLIDSKNYKNDDDVFFILQDGVEINFHETPTENERTITVPFNKDVKEIEIIGTQLFEKEIPIESLPDIDNEYDVEKIHNLSLERDIPLVLQTDKEVYSYGSDMIVTITNPYFIHGEPILLEIFNEKNEIVYKNSIPVDANAKGIYQEIIAIEGKDWSIPGSQYIIKANYADKFAELSIFTSDFGIAIELDQKVYSWTDKVYFTIVAPDLVHDPTKIEEIGDSPSSIVTISTSKGTLMNYKLIETDKDTGIFIGEITLTVFPGHDVFGNGKNSDVTGEISGTGPNDGKIGCSNNDGIVITLVTPTKTVSGSALIRWNIGEIQWLESSYPASGEGTIRVVDPDMNLNSEKIDEFEIKVWSDTDPVGIKLKVEETGKNTGIFKGTVKFTTEEQSSTPKLRVSEGDTITAEYVDRTLPDPYSKENELNISSTSVIGTLSPPLERIVAKNPRLLDSFGNSIEKILMDQDVQISADLINEQEIDQKFAYLVQITDLEGNQVSLASISGTLSSGQSLSPSLSWKPSSPGKFVATIFVWESVDNPTALSPPLDLEFIVEDDKISQPTPIETSMQQISSIPIVQKFPSKPTVSIPQGSAVPGCEQHDRCFLPSKMIIRVNQTVVWTNDDTAAHTVTSGTPDDGPDGNFDSGLFMAGSSFAHKFTKKGIYPYHCMVHP